jgi:NCAIR mutase (PurE)-related protein
VAPPAGHNRADSRCRPNANRGEESLSATTQELRLDHDRQARTGIAEAVYGPGKSPEQCAEAVVGLLARGTGPVLLTRADRWQVSAALAVRSEGRVTPTGHDATGGELSTVVWRPAAPRAGRVPVLAAGTADVPVAREAAEVLAAYGVRSPLVVDVGVAAIHRVLDQAPLLGDADVVIVVAGMEGALASVVAGLTPAPVIGVPTSTGYGAGLAGVTALLAMHASCSPGISVVGIDNGFGAACSALRLLTAAERLAQRGPDHG